MRVSSNEHTRTPSGNKIAAYQKRAVLNTDFNTLIATMTLRKFVSVATLKPACRLNTSINDIVPVN